VQDNKLRQEYIKKPGFIRNRFLRIKKSHSFEITESKNRKEFYSKINQSNIFKPDIFGLLQTDIKCVEIQMCAKSARSIQIRSPTIQHEVSTFKNCFFGWNQSKTYLLNSLHRVHFLKRVEQFKKDLQIGELKLFLAFDHFANKYKL
jgi:hypothetical protein